MKRLFWIGTGIVIGAVGYHYFREQAATTPEIESLAEQGRRLMERGRVLADTSRQLAEDGRVFAQTAASLAQSRGRDVFESVKGQAERLQGSDVVQRFREDVKDDTNEMGSG